MKLNDRLILLPMDLMLLQSTVSGSFMSLHHGGTWFVSCLAFCYIITPSVIGYLKQLDSSNCLKLICFLAFIDAYIFPVTQHMDYAGKVGVYDNVIYRGIEYIIGMLIAAIYISKNCDSSKKRKYNNIATLLLFVVLNWAMAHGTFLRSAYLTLPIFILLTINVLEIDNDSYLVRIASSGIVKAINKIAYEIFLAQFFCFSMTMWIVGKYQLTNQLLIFVLSLIICITIALLMNKLISVPGKRILQNILK